MALPGQSDFNGCITRPIDITDAAWTTSGRRAATTSEHAPQCWAGAPGRPTTSHTSPSVSNDP